MISCLKKICSFKGFEQNCYVIFHLLWVYMYHHLIAPDLITLKVSDEDKKL